MAVLKYIPYTSDIALAVISPRSAQKPLDMHMANQTMTAIVFYARPGRRGEIPDLLGLPDAGRANLILQVLPP